MNNSDAITTIQNNLNELISISQSVPESLLTWKPAEDEWSILEVLCHVEEAVPYWLNEVSKLIEQPEHEWGRGLQDSERLSAITNAGNRPLAEVLDAIKQSKVHVQNVLAPLSLEQLNTESPSKNPRFGMKPLSFIVEHLLMEHTATHVKQINRNIEQYSQA